MVMLKQGVQASGHCQSQYWTVRFRGLADKKDFSLTENSVRTTKEY